jgi:hypothetical protein
MVSTDIKHLTFSKDITNHAPNPFSHTGFDSFTLSAVDGFGIDTHLYQKTAETGGRNLIK